MFTSGTQHLYSLGHRKWTRAHTATRALVCGSALLGGDEMGSPMPLRCCCCRITHAPSSTIAPRHTTSFFIHAWGAPKISKTHSQQRQHDSTRDAHDDKDKKRNKTFHSPKKRRNKTWFRAVLHNKNHVLTH